MSRFGWAYVNSAITGAVANGPTNSVQFNSGSQVLSGSSNFTFDYATNTLYLTGTLRADNLIVSSSQILKSGSTIFGDDAGDTHQFTGSILGGIVSGTIARFIVVTGSSINSTFISGSSLVVSASVVSASTYLGLPTGGSTVPGDGDKSIQFNSGSTFSGSTNFTYDYTTNNINLTGALLMSGTSYISGVDYIDFDTSSISSHQEGRLTWVDDTKTLTIGTDVTNVEIEIGHQNVIRVRNQTGSPLNTGKVVYITGESGNRPLIQTASYESDAVSATTLGFVASYLDNNKNGYVVTNGILRDIDTSLYTAGTQLYLSSSGDFTSNVPLSPLHEVRLGKVIKQDTSGTIYVDIMNGYEIEELHNVLVTSASTGDLLVYNSSSAVWENTKSLSGSYIITGSLTVTANISGATGQFTSLTASSISANSVSAFGPAQSIQYNNAGVLNGSSNLTFDGVQVRVTGSVQVVSGSTIVAEMLASGVRTTGKPVQVRNASSILVGVIDETGTISGSIGRFGTITGSVITSSNEILVANNITVGGNIFGSNAIKGGLSTYTGSFTVPSTSYFVGISSTGSVITASLNSATSYPAGQTMYFKDVGGNAGTNNIRIQPSGSQTIDGANGGVVIANNSGSITLVSNGTDQFYIVGIV